MRIHKCKIEGKNLILGSLLCALFTISGFSADLGDEVNTKKHRMLTDSTIRYCTLLIEQKPSEMLPIVQGEFEKTGDYVYKLLEIRCYEALSMFHQATRMGLYLIEHEEVKRDTLLKASFYLQLASLSYLGNDYEGCLKFYQKGYDIGVEIEDTSLILSGFSGLALSYQGLGDFEKAEKFYKKVIPLYNRGDEGGRFKYHSTLTNLGLIYCIQGRSLEALEKFYPSHIYFKERGHYEYTANTAQGIAVAYLDLEAYDSSAVYFDTTYAYLKKLNSPWFMRFYYEDKALYYNRLGDVEMELRVKDSLIHYLELVKNQESEEALKTLESKFELENTLREVELQSLILEKGQAESEASANFHLFLFVLVLLFLAVLVSAFFIYRSEKKKRSVLLEKQISKLEMKALRTQMNPHFVFNCLNSIQYLFLTQKEQEANLYLVKFSNLLRTILEHSKMDEISLEDEVKMLHLYCDLENLQFDNPFELKTHIDEMVDPKMVSLPSMLFQPFVENAIKHGLKNSSKKGEIRVSFKVADNVLIGEVEDNGVGREMAMNLRSNLQNREYRSRGIEITKERAEVFGHLRKMKIVTEVIDKYDAQRESAGTLIRVKIPLA